MKPTESLARFLARGSPMPTPRAALQAMVDFYVAERAEGCDVDDDGDMLLCEWGRHRPPVTVGEQGYFSITRQFMWTGDDGESILLALTVLGHAPSLVWGTGQHWCEHPDRVAGLLSAVLAAEAFGPWADDGALTMTVALDRV
jgi:hypothetical protein